MRFVYITDTHFGGQNCWGQQTTYPELVPDLFRELVHYLQDNPVDFVLHGGDLTDRGTPEQFKDAMALTEMLSCPLYLVPGNHDMVCDNAIDVLSTMTNLFPAAKIATLDSAIASDNAVLLTVTNTWQPPNSKNAFQWDKSMEQTAGLTDKQYLWIKQQLSTYPDKPFILAMHELLYPLPPRLTGEPDPIHVPPGPYINEIRDFILQHPQIKLVLSGHCHASCLTVENDTYFVTTAAFFEPPFQARIITVDKTRMELSAVYPFDMKKHNITGTPEDFWSAGQAYDREITIL